MSAAALILLAFVANVHADVSPEIVARSGNDSPRADYTIKNEQLQRELDRFKDAQLSLREALMIAEAHHVPSRIVDISFNGRPDRPVYQVRTSRGEYVWDDAIDARSGAFVAASTKSLIGHLETQDRGIIVALGSVRQELLDAVVVAERNTSGQAISAGLIIDRGRLEFVVVCVVGRDLKQVRLEPPGATSHRKR